MLWASVFLAGSWEPYYLQLSSLQADWKWPNGSGEEVENDLKVLNDHKMLMVEDKVWSDKLTLVSRTFPYMKSA